MNCHTKHRNLSAVTGGKRRIASSRLGRSRQHGMTLIIGLILLVILMVISTIGFRNTTLSERMTGNAFDRNTSLQSAENAGIEAVRLIVANGFNAALRGHYNPALAGGVGGGTAFWTQGAGATLVPSACASTEPFSWTSCSASVATRYTFATNANSAQNAELAQYVIELLSRVESAPTIGAQATPGRRVSTYRVTSRSTGGSGNAELVLQSIYVQVVCSAGNQQITWSEINCN